MSRLTLFVTLSIVILALSQTTIVYYQDADCEVTRNVRFYPFCSTGNTRLTYYTCTPKGFWEYYYVRGMFYYSCGHYYPETKTRTLSPSYGHACLRDAAVPGLSEMGKCGGTYNGALFESYRGKSCQPDYVQWNEIDTVNTCWPCYGTQCNKISIQARSFTYECSGDKYQGKYYNSLGCTGTFTLDNETYVKDRCYAFSDDSSWKFRGCNVAYTHNDGITSTLRIIIFAIALFIGIN